MKSPTLLWLLWLLITSLSAQDLTAVQRRALDGIVEQQLPVDKPGLAVGVVRDGKVIYSAYRGLADMAHVVPVDGDTRFNIASVAKQFTALCVLRLVEAGKLNLEDDIRKYLPDLYSNIKSPIRLRHLLNHSSGIRDFYDLLSVKLDPWWRKEGYANDDAIELLARQRDLNFEPGTEHLYSNSNYTLLTKVVEVVTGTSFHNYSRERFDELGMNATNFLENYMYIIPNLARPYTDWGDLIWQEYPMMTSLYGDGFLFTTLPDQLRYEVAVQTAKAGTYLDKSQRTIPDAEIDTYGFGLELGTTLGRPSVTHSGGTGAYNAQTVRFPAENLSIVAMSNNGTIWSGNVVTAIARELLGAREEGADLPNKPYAATEDTPQSPSALAGAYESPEKEIIRLYEEDGALWWRQGNNNPRKLVREAGNFFYWDIYPDFKVAFYPKAAKADLTMTVYYAGSEPRDHARLPAFTPDDQYFSAFAGDYRSTELDAEFTLTYDAENKLRAHYAGREKASPVALFARDRLRIMDFRVTVERDYYDRVESLLLSTGRAKNLRFTKSEDRTFYPQKPTPDGGMISVATTRESYGEGKGDILLTKNLPNGNEEWSTSFGGPSYERASSVNLTKDGGYLIVGSTSSFGNGNYNVYLVRTDAKGRELWSRAFGGDDNEYGYTVKELNNGNILVKGTRARVVPWTIETDAGGNLLREAFGEMR